MVVAAAAFALEAYGLLNASRPLWGVVLVPIVMAAGYPLLRRMASRETSFDLFGIVYLGLALRLIGIYYRSRMAADARVYLNVGNELADYFVRLHFSVDTGRDIPGTGTVRYAAGLALAVTGRSEYATYLVFTLLAFIGAILLYKAFVTAFPNGRAKRYAMLVFLWPSMVFWPSSVGKEALMVFGIGLASYGAARMFTHRPLGATAMALGLVLLVLIRPHVALVVLVSVGAAYLFVRSTSGSVVMSGGKIVALAALLVAGAIISTQTAEFLNLENLGSGSVNTAFTDVEGQTVQGGGEFSPIRADRTPVLFPLAMGTVLFRPLPFEAHNLESLLSSLEGLLLIGLTLGSWRSLIRIPRTVVREPYVAYTAAATLLACYMFSVIGNFGILTRQRTQLLPLYFVLLCIPLAVSAVKPATTAPRKRASLLDP